MVESVKSYMGSVAIVGRPNVGKSTLLNAILGEKISITSKKPQTTRHRILGIKTQEAYQVVYLDTPGFHKNTPRRLNRAMNRTVIGVLQEADLILFVVDCRSWTDEDDLMLTRLKQQDKPVILVLNKTDAVKDRLDLLPIIETMSLKMTFMAVVPVSALKDKNIDTLEKVINEHLPEGDHFFAADDITDCSDTFLTAELIREKLMRLLGDELPYSITVQIEKFDNTETLLRIAGLIWVEKPGQKAIVIGNKGSMLKKVGQLAREDMEILFDKKVFLHLWVKVKSGWSDDDHLLKQLGYATR
ncbi:MAG: GTPase Era [Gammaproteobacteria bacterium]|nr:GTPase Era [Gammaproteobacteria bacterium]